MPLVTPTSVAGNKTDEWTNKLVGKTIHDDESTTTVSSPHPPFCCRLN